MEGAAARRLAEACERDLVEPSMDGTLSGLLVVFVRGRVAEQLAEVLSAVLGIEVVVFLHSRRLLQTVRSFWLNSVS